MIRRLAERLSRNIVVRRRWPDRFGGGHIYVSPDASLRMLAGRFDAADPELLQAASLLVRPGDTVWDIGANVGLFTFASAHMTGGQGKVLALEADAWLASVMRRTARIRSGEGTAEVQVISVAVAGAPGVVRFNVANRGRAVNFVGDTGHHQMTGGVRESQHMVAVTLDWLAQHVGPPHVIKIDVEAMEIPVLEGGARVLAEIRPRLYVEIAEQSRHAAADLFRRHDYVSMAIVNGRLTPVEEPAWNTAAIPRERVSEFL